MVPELHPTRQEAAPLVQALGRDVAPRGYYGDIPNFPLLKPAERMMYQLPDNCLVLHPTGRTHQADLAAAVVFQVAADVTSRLRILFGHQHDVRIPVAALLDPPAIHLVAQEDRKAPVLIKARIVIAAACNLTQRWNVRGHRLADAVIVPGSGIHVQQRAASVTRTLISWNPCSSARWC